jgi:hypothetical protein
MRGRDGVYIRDLPPRRALARDFEFSSSSRTGGYDARRELGDVTSPAKGTRVLNHVPQKDKAHVDVVQKKKKGTYVRRERKTDGEGGGVAANAPLGAKNQKRGTNQVWLPVNVQVVGEGSSESAGKRQHTVSVFDRLEDPSAAPAAQGRRSQ